MHTFKPRKYIDPITKEIKVFSPEEQIEMLEKGIILDVAADVEDLHDNEPRQ